MDEEKAQISGENGQKKTAWKPLVKEVLTFLIIIVGIVWPFRLFVAEPFIVDGSSMDPTFHTGDYLIVDKLSYDFKLPARNSVIIFKFPTLQSRDLIKRVIGLPGDTIISQNGVVTIVNADNPNGFTLPEKYLAYVTADNFKITLGADQFFVMGDNRPKSYDSRYWGVLPKSDIIGRPILRLWPVWQTGTMPGDQTNSK